eukprot:4685956-Amphidinium_carterae.1
MRRSGSDEELQQFAAQLPRPQGVVDMAMSGVSGNQGIAGWRAAHSLSDSARPETPSADGGMSSWSCAAQSLSDSAMPGVTSASGGDSSWSMVMNSRVIQAEMVRGTRADPGWNWSGSQDGNDPE